MKMFSWVLRKDGSIDLAKTSQAAQKGGNLFLNRFKHPRAGVLSPSERGACARRPARARVRDDKILVSEPIIKDGKIIGHREIRVIAGPGIE